MLAQAGGPVCEVCGQELGTGLRLLIPRKRTRGEDAFTLPNLLPWSQSQQKKTSQMLTSLDFQVECRVSALFLPDC